MQITIVERLAPFTHTPGTDCILPLTSLNFKIFPTLIEIQDLQNPQESFEPIHLNVIGPVQDFTIQQDLHKGRILVWGRSSQEYFRYGIYPLENFPFYGIKVEKGLSFLNLKEGAFSPVPMPIFEHLSLGSHKAQDIDLIKRRFDLKEIFPLWYTLGQLVKMKDVEKISSQTLLSLCLGGELNAFKNLFRAGFKGLLTPVNQDPWHQGFSQPVIDAHESPLFVLKKGADFIRRLFLEEGSECLSLLPNLPTEFHAGRFLHLNCKEIGTLDIEWSKKLLRRVLLSSKKKKCLHITFQKDLKSFRLRCFAKDRGRHVSTQDDLELEEGVTYLMDNFTC